MLFVSGYAPKALLDTHRITLDTAELLPKPFTRAELPSAMRRALAPEAASAGRPAHR